MTYDVIITLSYCKKNYVGLNIKQTTFVNSQHKNKNFKGVFVLQTGFKRSFERFIAFKNKSESNIYYISLLLYGMPYKKFCIFLGLRHKCGYPVE